MSELRCRRVLTVLPEEVQAVHFLSPQRLVVSGSYLSPKLEYHGGAVRLVTPSGRLLAKAFTGWATGRTAVRPGGAEVACTARRSCIIRSLRSRRLPVVRQLVFDDQKSACLLYTPDARWLVWGGQGRIHPSPDWRHVDWNPASPVVPRENMFQTLVRWDTVDWTPQVLIDRGQPVSCLALSPDGGTLLVGGGDGGIQLWDTSRWEMIAKWQASPLQEVRGFPSVYAVQMSPDGHTLYAAFNGPPYIRAFTLPGFIPALPFDQFDRVYAMLLLPGGRTLATGDEAGEVKLWDVASGAVVGRYRAVGGERRTLGIGTGRPERLPVEVAEVSSLAVSPDGRTLAAGDFVGRVHLLDLTP